MKDVKIIIIDIDGTLTNSNKNITEYTKEVIKKVKDMGIYVILCSGRTNMYVISKSIDVNASNYVISSNGSLVYDYINEEKIYEEEISKDKINDFCNYCMENKLGIKLNATNNRYYNQFMINKSECIDEYNSNCLDHITQFYVEINDKKKLVDINNYLLGNNIFKIVNYCTKGIDIVKKNVSKGQGILKLLEYLHISSNEALCFGDSNNDISMFNVCKYKVAMKNASKDIIETSNYITLTNDEDGVAHFLEDNIINI